MGTKNHTPKTKRVNTSKISTFPSRMGTKNRTRNTEGVNTIKISMPPSRMGTKNHTHGPGRVLRVGE